MIAWPESPPLWSAFLAVFSAVGARSYEAHELVACAVGAATVVCGGLLGRRLGGERAGLVAGGGGGGRGRAASPRCSCPGAVRQLASRRTRWPWLHASCSPSGWSSGR